MTRVICQEKFEKKFKNLQNFIEFSGERGDFVTELAQR